MNKARDFLHNHPKKEFDKFTDHVIIDRDHWQLLVSRPSLFTRFHNWMLENDTMEKAEQWANYDDEDMFRAFLIDQKLAI